MNAVDSRFSVLEQLDNVKVLLVVAVFAPPPIGAQVVSESGGIERRVIKNIAKNSEGTKEKVKCNYAPYESLRDNHLTASEHAAPAPV